MSLKRKIEKHAFNNIEPLLIKKYNSTLPDNVADVICAIDMFFVIKKPAEFLAELKRILKKEGTLVIDDGHQSRSETKTKILNSGLWSIYEETRDHLKCRQK
jgi:ubiquinone/menaquinone biosynthesis C-methylase UbiE